MSEALMITNSGLFQTDVEIARLRTEATILEKKIRKLEEKREKDTEHLRDRAEEILEIIPVKSRPFFRILEVLETYFPDFDPQQDFLIKENKQDLELIVDILRVISQHGDQTGFTTSCKSSSPKENTSEVSPRPGVRKNNKKFRAYVKIVSDGSSLQREVPLGTFDTVQNANLAQEIAEKILTLIPTDYTVKPYAASIKKPKPKSNGSSNDTGTQLGIVFDDNETENLKNPKHWRITSRHQNRSEDSIRPVFDFILRTLDFSSAITNGRQIVKFDGTDSKSIQNAWLLVQVNWEQDIAGHQMNMTVYGRLTEDEADGLLFADLNNEENRKSLMFSATYDEPT